MGRRQNFTNSIIYHIRHMESKEVVYVGSTTNFSQRKTKHKYNCNHEGKECFTYPIYSHIRDNGGFDCFEVIPIQSLKLENKTQLLIAEQEEIDKHQTLVNGRKAHVTIEEKRIDHIESTKKWSEAHKAEYKQYQKKYREANQDYHKEKSKTYYQSNKAEIIEKYKQKIECKFCHKLKTKGNMLRHMKTCQSKPKEEN